MKEEIERIPTPNSFQSKNCEGSCEEHRGPIRRVEVKSDGHPNGTWGEFWYCQEAIEEDKRRGLNPVLKQS